jgi:predicted transglutaminase-like cysteine proteinase
MVLIFSLACPALRALLRACALLPCLIAPPCSAASAQEAPIPEEMPLRSAEEAGPSVHSPGLSGFSAMRLNPHAKAAQQFLELWSGVLSRHVPENAFGAGVGMLPSPVLAQWRNLSRLMPGWPPEKKLQNINGFFNSRDAKSDRDNYALEEYWASPEEFLEKGGDCEDFAIAKYLALRYFGWPERRLWILLLKNKKNGENHAALAAEFGEKLFILDNLSRPVYLLIPEKDYWRNFTPLYAVNGLGVWMLTRPPSGATKCDG